MREALGVEVSVIDLFQYSTVRQLAEHVDARRAEGGAPHDDTAAAQAGQDRAAMRREMMRRGRR
jgi:phosphopantetheine binding protein